MKTLSLKLDDNIYEETEKLLQKIDQPRNRYINEAIRYYNTLKKQELISKQLAFESHLVSQDSLSVLNEFEQLDENEGE
jgi:predicted transcriptional regulator